MFKPPYFYENNQTTTMTIKERLIKKISDGELAFKDERQIFIKLNVRPSQKKAVISALCELESDGEILRDRQGGFATPEQLGAFTATVQGNERGFAFLIPDDGSDDCFVPRRSLCGALHKDRVLAARRRGTEDEAYVVKILERGMKRVVGTFERDRRAGYVLPDERKFDSDVYIPLSLCGGAKVGDKVVAEITGYPKDKPVGGKVVEILGESGDFYVEEDAIIRSYGLYEEFPSAAVKQAEEAAKMPVILGKRRDLRNLTTVTIDGEDTRDIDDAVSLTREGKNYILGVHIADVSEYVKSGGATDKEAYRRGTSVYFPDRVLPMLPKALSNGACSLNEGENRYAMSAVMTFDENGKRLKAEFCESVIISDKRMTYTEVTDIVEGGKTAVNPDICRMLCEMRELCLLLEKRRKAAGEVNLDVKEAHIYVDEKGEIEIPDSERSISHRMIEQFMISANEAVAEGLKKRGAPCLYRVHEKPAPEKASSFFSFLRDLGVNAAGDVSDIKPSDFKKILESVEGKPYADIVNRLMLRAMQKARYSKENIGHFGLASDCYCHFTSPIRRYPDLFVHRALKLVIRGEVEEAKRLYENIAAETAKDASEREVNAERAERDVDDLYKVAYMSERIGEEYDAVISGVTNFGIFAELPNSIEGIIRVDALPRDGYAFIEEKLLLKGAFHSYKIGQSVRVKVAGCDYSSMRVQFVMVE